MAKIGKILMCEQCSDFDCNMRPDGDVGYIPDGCLLPDASAFLSLPEEPTRKQMQKIVDWVNDHQSWMEKMPDKLKIHPEAYFINVDKAAADREE